MNIRCDSTENAPDVDICDNIKISGRYADDKDSYEYKQLVTLFCASCDTYHDIWILIN